MVETIIITGIVLAIIGCLFKQLIDTKEKLRDLESQLPTIKKKAADEALKVSRRVIKGQVSEQVAPFLKGFPYEATDLKFFGNGFDYVCVVNMANARDTDEEIKEVVFIDIKTGKAKLSVVQGKIRDAIVDGRVAWETMTINEDNSVSVVRAEKKIPKILEKTLDTKAN